MSVRGRITTLAAKVYDTWHGMIGRCYNPKIESFHLYGGRGISVCERWKAGPGAFAADMGEPPSMGHSIDRIDPNGNYEPSNCRWATAREQRLNQRPRVRRRH